MSSFRVAWYELPLRTRRLGRPVMVCVQEPPLSAFGADIPDVLSDPLADAYRHLGLGEREEARAEWERWLDALLSRAIVEPCLSIEEIRHLGGDRDLLGERLFAAWGVTREVPYRRTFLAMVRRFAKELRMLPTDVLALPTGLFWTNYMILFGPDAESEHAAS